VPRADDLLFTLFAAISVFPRSCSFKRLYYDLLNPVTFIIWRIIVSSSGSLAIDAKINSLLRLPTFIMVVINDSVPRRVGDPVECDGDPFGEE
jgi:hypothetical protein